jgi:hypothetical protein
MGDGRAFHPGCAHDSLCCGFHFFFVVAGEFFLYKKKEKKKKKKKKKKKEQNSGGFPDRNGSVQKSKSPIGKKKRI